MNILEVMADVFAFAFPGATWDAWRAFLAALFALPMSAPEIEVYRRCTGRDGPPASCAREAWMIVGRRAGKSRVAALIAVYLACFRRYQLAPGERGVVMLIAADRRQARVLKRYVEALIAGVPMLQAMLAKEPTAESIDLTNGVSIEIHSASFRAVRGYTCVAVVADEIAFWRTDDAANPDTEIVAAIRPALATMPGALLVALSSPYARRGELWKAYKRYFGKADGHALVWQAESVVMNPSPALGPEVARAYDEDPVAAASEWGAQFRSDLETFVSKEVLERCVMVSRAELPPVAGIGYHAFTDPSGGSVDSFTLAIAHHADRRVVIDCVREVRAPFSPDGVVKEFASILQAYGLREVTGDRYAGAWPGERFEQHGVTYHVAGVAKSDLYRDLLPLLTGDRVELLDHRALVLQLGALERRTGRGGRDAIDHPPGGRDDVANAVAGAAALAIVGLDPSVGFISQPKSPSLDRLAVTIARIRASRFHQHREES